MEINQPIFIVGCARSGTTLLYNLICGHQDSTWFSNYTNALPSCCWLSHFNFLFKIPAVSKNLRANQWEFGVRISPTIIPLPVPDEGYNLWNLFHPVRQRMNPHLTATDAEDTNVLLMKKTILSHLLYSGSTRFVNKHVRNTVRSQYLRAIFPDALFIHLIRDGRAVTSSLLRVSQHILGGKRDVLSITRLWKSEVRTMLFDSKTLPKRQYFEVRYERLTEKPVRVLKNLLNFCNLDWSTDFEEHIRTFDIQNRNYKWKGNLTQNQISTVEQELNPLLKRLGYKI